MTTKTQLLLAGCLMLCGSLLAHRAPAGRAPQSEKGDLDSLYGLYYGDWKELGGDGPALVISPDGKPIPKKENDPQAPTLPGLHVNGQHFDFAWSQLTSQGFAFRTVRVEGHEFSFHGKFGREQIDDIGEVPYLEGTLTKKSSSRVTQEKKVHFSHAVVL